MFGRELHLTFTALAASRALLRAHTEEEVVATVMDVVLEFGAAPVPPRGDEGEIPVDITFGIGDPLVPSGDSELVGDLAEILPAVVEDARVALDRLRREAYLAVRAHTDVLTGLANERVATRVLSRIEPGDVVAMVDLDELRVVNDTHGHEVGDAVLRSFATTIRTMCRAADLAGRLGGEEFILLLRRADATGAVALFDRLAEHWAATRPQPVTFSAGVAVAGTEAPQETLRRAGEALAAAKAGGRGRVEVAAS